MEFRNVRIKDIEKVRELEISCIREYFAVTLENKWEDLPQDWKDGLGASSPRHFKTYLDSGLSFVAEEDGEIVGFIFAQMLHHICDEDNLLWVENMGVHPYFRRNEIGYRLLRECIRKGREMGATVVHSSIQPDNAPSILLHKKMGFFIDRRDVALLDLRDPALRLRRGGARPEPLTCIPMRDESGRRVIVITITVIYITVISITIIMRFYGREKELSTLRSIKERSLKESTFTTVLGKRRVGKTALIMESVRDTRYVYLFVTRLDQKVLCGRMQRAMSDAGIDVPGTIDTVGDILKALMIHSRVEPITVVIDEFQELRHVDPSIFGDIQMVWDAFREGSHIDLIVSGSVHSMMAAIFEDEKEPLFRRPTAKIRVEPFPLAQMKAILEEHNPGHSHEDELTLYMLTGGVPYYIGVLMDAGAVTSDAMLEAALSNGSVFLSDGKDILVSEFGKDYRTYFSILQLISQGRERRSEIDGILGMQVGAYLARLQDEYSFAKQISPVPGRPRERNSRWVVSDMYLRFYFRFVQPYSDYIEMGRSDLHLRAVRAGLGEYEGRALEDYFRRRIAEESEYTEIGGYWSRDGTVEIDIVVLDDISRKAELIEVKRNPAKLDMGELKAKGKALEPLLKKYEVSYRGLSMDDVRGSGTFRIHRVREMVRRSHNLGRQAKNLNEIEPKCSMKRL